eukprot:CAMPEP_0116005000 /NCGR_PEP_ID=MMETSP0321-20121206/917_1 /TAXON_ID=163516 /ORGANISM="Leptocylindrus danicus var. danicus, Strain B650" /LENGTH=65 /DNA_ID=CAMNT_0003473369 /DNA_START=497 /DNA_END=694 /DNA_ORIENTATION=+
MCRWKESVSGLLEVFSQQVEELNSFEAVCDNSTDSEGVAMNLCVIARANKKMGSGTANISNLNFI